MSDADFVAACLDEAMRAGVYGDADFRRAFPEWRADGSYAKVVNAVTAARVWAFVRSRPFWDADPNADAAGHARAVAVARAAVRHAVGRGLIDVPALVDLLGDALLSDMEPQFARDALRRALEHGAAGRPFTLRELLGAQPVEALLQIVPASVIWSRVVEPLVERMQLLKGPDSKDFAVASRDRRALQALLRSKTGMTMEIDTTELLFEPTPSAAGVGAVPPPLPGTEVTAARGERAPTKAPVGRTHPGIGTAPGTSGPTGHAPAVAQSAQVAQPRTAPVAQSGQTAPLPVHPGVPRRPGPPRPPPPRKR